MKVDSRAAMIERRQEPQRGPQWEYLSKLMDADAELDQFGAEGWELVTAVPASHNPPMAVYHFKRRRG